MTYEFTVLMGLVDFIPVLLFAVSMVLMQRDLYNKMPKYSFACFAAGTINILPTQSLGFLLAGLGIILMLTNRKKAALALAAPPVFSGSIVFISMMVLGLGAICSCLGILAAKMKKKGLIPIFVLCFFTYMAMGYLGSRDSNTAAANWLEQGVNTLGQVLLLWGVLGLHRAGLRDYRL